MLVPAYKEDQRGPAIQDPESLVSCPISMPDTELGAVVTRLLRDQRPRDFEMDFRGEGHRQRLAVRRKLLCKAFGVRATKDWLAAATSVSIVDTGGNITVTPWRRDGKQDAWSRQQGDPVGTALHSDQAQVGATVHRMLALRLPPIR